ncbi:hypothetical protein LGM39_25125 [Burkholderia cepacia]|uniref:hypothetical protein n=1 Tax=Burkholderia cepacia TaxID=292 RepID=UPI001CF3B99D|nr:hypothetical protein [Burkholderia cepacia]MCA7902657.1 hypothetical protein [Burkholderia cepacia]
MGFSAAGRRRIVHGRSRPDARVLLVSTTDLPLREPAPAGAVHGRRASRAGGSRVGIHDVDRSQGSTMSDSSFRPSRDCPSGSRGGMPAIRQMNCHAAIDATIPG